MWYPRAYPENLSRIILTLTVSPMLYQMLRTKFSSIQGSSSPILASVSTIRLARYHPGFLRARVDSPESRLSGALALTVATSAAWRAHVALGREAVAGSVHGLAHVAGLRGRVVHVALGRALELVGVAVVERHVG